MPLSPVNIAQAELQLDILLEQLVLGAGAQCEPQDLARSIQTLCTDLPGSHTPRQASDTPADCVQQSTAYMHSAWQFNQAKGSRLAAGSKSGSLTDLAQA